VQSTPSPTAADTTTPIEDLPHSCIIKKSKDARISWGVDPNHQYVDFQIEMAGTTGYVAAGVVNGSPMMVTDPPHKVIIFSDDMSLDMYSLIDRGDISTVR